MELTMIIILIFTVIILLLKDSFKSKSETNEILPKKTSEAMIFPYRKKYLLSKNEYAFYRILKNKCDENKLLICPKVRLEDIVEVNTKQNINKYRGYIRSRHIDFIICDDKLNVLCAIELDDSSHNTSKAKRVDEFKNKLFETVKLPLYRIRTSYEENINNIILEITQKIGHLN